MDINQAGKCWAAKVLKMNSCSMESNALALSVISTKYSSSVLHLA